MEQQLVWLIFERFAVLSQAFHSIVESLWMLKDVCICHFQLRRWKILTSSFAGKFSTEGFDRVLCNLISFNYVKDRISFIYSLRLVRIGVEHTLLSLGSSFSSIPPKSFVHEKIVSFLCGVLAMYLQAQLTCWCRPCTLCRGEHLLSQKGDIRQRGSKGRDLHIRDESKTFLHAVPQCTCGLSLFWSEEQDTTPIEIPSVVKPCKDNYKM